MTNQEHRLQKAHPKHQTGKYRSIKNASSAVLQLTLFVTPWINWHGRQMILLDLPGRKLHLFGWTLWPQETYFLFLLLMIAGLVLFCVTALLGRIWCGYACPQTIFSHSFVLVERLIEGDRHRRLKLEKSPWNKDKISKKLAKWSIMLAMSLYLGFTFAGYYTPIRPLLRDILSGSAQTNTLLIVGFFAGVSLFFFGFLRGRFCTTMCPYARFQGALFDRDTVMVNYDYTRGEPRGKVKDPDAGSCVDCSLCVQVCPQNIDIRNGIQFECINCAACVDACDSVMTKVNRPLGLIRMASETEIEGGTTSWLRSRPIFYALASLSAIGVLALMLTTRIPLDLDVTRDAKSGAFGQVADGRVSNLYNIRLINKENPATQVKLSLDGFDKAELVVPVNPLMLDAESSQVVKVFVLVKSDEVRPVHHFRFVLTDVDNPNIQRSVDTTFLRGAK